MGFFSENFPDVFLGFFKPVVIFGDGTEMSMEVSKLVYFTYLRGRIQPTYIRSYNPFTKYHQDIQYITSYFSRFLKTNLLMFCFRGTCYNFGEVLANRLPKLLR